MFSSFNSLSGIKCANASAAANFISSVILDARTSIAPRKIPGNTATLLIWLGASERPVPAMRTPAAFISAYVASGLGFAIANTIASSAKFSKISFVKAPAADTPRRMSAPLAFSAKLPCFSSRPSKSINSDCKESRRL